MNTVEEIEQAAEQLAPSDFDRLASWVSARYHDLWKRQMERDATAGRLDFLFNESRRRTPGRFTPRLACGQGMTSQAARERLAPDADASYTRKYRRVRYLGPARNQLELTLK